MSAKPLHFSKHARISLFLFFSAFTKLLVGVGNDVINIIDDIEIVDLASTKTKCDKMPKFPVETFGAVGGLDYNDNPLICGGGYNGRQVGIHWMDTMFLKRQVGYKACKQSLPNLT